MHYEHTCGTCEWTSEFITAQLIAGDPRLKDKVLPRGAVEPLPALTNDVPMGEPEIDKAVVMWEELMEDLPNLLHAVAIGAKLTAGDPLYDDVKGDWEFDFESKRYTNTKTGKTLDDAEKDQESLNFLDLYLLSLFGLSNLPILYSIVSTA